jgi:hypothetical protein
LAMVSRRVNMITPTYNRVRPMRTIPQQVLDFRIRSMFVCGELDQYKMAAPTANSALPSSTPSSPQELSP